MVAVSKANHGAVNIIQYIVELDRNLVLRMNLIVT